MMPLIALCLLVCSSMTQAVIIRVAYLKNTMPELKAEKFVFFSDYHVPMPADEEQLDALTQVLLKRDKESDQDMHILVEQPAGTPFHYSVMGHIRDRLKNCVHTQVQDVEMRCFTGAACFMLNPERNPHSICPDIFYETSSRACCVNTVSMQEIDIEVNEYKDQIDAWMQTLPPHYASVVRIFQSEFDGCLRDYRRACSVHNITPESNILRLSRMLYQKDPAARERLYKRIDDLSSVLFDMHILKSIFSLKTPHIIGLVTGAWHASRVLGKLERMGNQVIACYGSSYGPDIKPLPQKHLDIDPGCCSCCWGCPIQ